MYENVFLSLNRRLPRKEYLFLSIIPFLIISYPALTSIAISYTLRAQDLGILPIILTGLSVVIGLLLVTAPTIQRLHDFDAPGWLIVLLFIPYISLLMLLVLLCVPGSKSENQYGLPAHDRHRSNFGDDYRPHTAKSLWKPALANLLISLMVGSGLLASTIYQTLYADPIKTGELLALSAPTDYPQIVLTNAASFKGHTSLYGASAFLVTGPDDKPLLLTARHLIGDSGGVSPEIEPQELDNAIEHWIAHPRTQPENSIGISGNFLPAMGRTNLDVLALNTIEQPDFPAKILSFRDQPPQIGELVYIAGCEYAEADCLQRMWPAQIVDIVGMEPFASYDIALKDPIALAGFSGAPVIDQDGNALAVVTSGWNEDETGKYNFISAESIEFVRRGGVGGKSSPK
ncbi:DUF805 domain-containing protein [Microbulbifer sp. SA54]|uniref:DUF805 domain-containing protein n=1 Tax=Microbulbifer sp. SA54 TaxID=3401577 RepID=UPI003AADC34F